MTRRPAETNSRGADWQRVRRLLCVRLDGMGDVLMTSPALRAAKRSSDEERFVTLLTSPAGAEVARLIPEVDEVLVYEAPWVKATAERRSSALDRDLVRRLADRAFDAAVIFTVYSQNPLPAAMTCWFADIPRRLAYCRENPYQLLTDRIPEREPEQLFRHEVRRQLDLVAAVGWVCTDERMRLALPAAARSRATERLAGFRASAGPDGKFWAVLHPGASAPSRRYPAEHFVSAMRALIEQYGWRFVLTGTEPERSLLERIRDALPAGAAALACNPPLAELAALIDEAPLLISNNTGPVHIAAAVGTPVVDLYALTNLQHTPWKVPGRVLFTDVPCRSCYKSICPEGHHRCLDAVAPERVVQAALELVASAAPAGRECEPDLPAEIARLAGGRREAPPAKRVELIPSWPRHPALAAAT